jgi:glyoxylase-like metal-dependent hydrolase (beta-lactamase superfamily II)
MFESALNPIVAGRIWSLERPVWFSGARLRARTTVVRLDDGSLLLHTPAPPTDALAEQLRALGPVRWLVVPNRWHHLGAPAAALRFPEAKVVGPATALARNRALKLDVDIHGSAFGEQVPEFEALALQGVPFLDETLLYHRPTQTLLGADIVCWAGAKDHWTWRCGARLTGCYDRVRVPSDVRNKIVDESAAARSLRALLDRPAQRLIVGHGEVIEEGWRDQLARAWRQEGVDV